MVNMHGNVLSRSEPIGRRLSYSGLLFHLVLRHNLLLLLLLLLLLEARRADAAALKGAP